MPTYSYACPKCGKVEDIFHSITKTPRVKCKKCGGMCKRRLGSGSGIIFKGSGFYETDYKRSGGSGGGEKKSDSGSESKNESKSESKGGDGATTKSESSATASGAEGSGKGPGKSKKKSDKGD